ncbi:hypothetical protein M501DRAFT_984837 [Patellaria atrata CBS 101060]|uniref:Uncharacterized protein n=1 Tax=Patellaria atrata CBS 101060 TaxID=1346257 RepID=A0A9P4SGT2_9PEZI|nr:hypothetical protein M501DRAFT_984836 [Patellaria atrata CBS 101060]KAF2842632.1 hypothetical protein M501DRAFT_984837 [Patellaria atrata CBS 101060]
MLEAPYSITRIQKVDEPMLLEDIVDPEATQAYNLKQMGQIAVGNTKDRRVDLSGTFPTPPPDTPSISEQAQPPARTARNADEAQETGSSAPMLTVKGSAGATEDPGAAPPSFTLSGHPWQRQSSSLGTDEEGEVIDVESGQDKPTQEELVE